MNKPRILIQLDPDKHASAFDAVVAADAGVDHLLQYSGVAPDDVQGLVHGAMFTRGSQDLNSTAIFIGGTDVAAGERLLRCVTECFFGPMRVSVLLDANGANTTAAAAVLVASRHLSLQDTRATVLAGTGPVGQRAARLLANCGARVCVASRRLARAEAVCQTIREISNSGHLEPCETSTPDGLIAALDQSQLVIAAGAFGVQLLPKQIRNQCPQLRVAVDLNAVPPLGVEGIERNDQGEMRDGVICYGAIGVGGVKMKIHKAAVMALFDSNDLILDAEEVFAIGQHIASQAS